MTLVVETPTILLSCLPQTRYCKLVQPFFCSACEVFILKMLAAKPVVCVQCVGLYSLQRGSVNSLKPLPLPAGIKMFFYKNKIETIALVHTFKWSNGSGGFILNCIPHFICQLYMQLDQELKLAKKASFDNSKTAGILQYWYLHSLHV